MTSLTYCQLELFTFSHGGNLSNQEGVLFWCG